MRIRTGMMATVAGAMLLSGCANWDVDGTAAMPNQGDAFSAALHKAYIEHARFERNEEDWISVDFFTSRAELAAKGMAPAPQAPSDRKIKVDAEGIQTSYAMLVEALDMGAGKTSPTACAESQGWLEHWMEQAEEGHQVAHIAMARKALKEVLPNCTGHVPEVSLFSIYFPFSGSKLTAEAKSVIDQIASLFSKTKPGIVKISGHTDTVGSKSSNMKLGMKRADSVAKALTAKGVSPIAETSYGETMLPVKTADGVKEQKNRTVRISFGE